MTKYIYKEVLQKIEDISKNLGRAPSRREFGNMSYGAIRIFGSWNNAILAAGFEPNRSHDQKMYRRSKTKATDGHLCDSISEAIIDNWLTQNNIPHKRDMPYPSTKHKADWAINDSTIFIEYFGLANDSLRYDSSIKEKIRICKENKIKLIDIYPKDLYPKSNLNKILVKLS